MNPISITWLSIALVAIGALLSPSILSASAQIPSASPNTNVNTANETTMQINRLQSLIVKSTIEDQTIGNDLRISHRWSNITDVPAGKMTSISAYCEKGSLALSGGFELGSSNLQVIGSHMMPENATAPSGWIGTVVNQNASSPTTPAAVSVLCLNSETSVPSQQSSQSQQEQSPEPSQPKQSSGTQAEGLTVKTDHQSYSRGDTIQITGTVADRKPGATVLVEVTDPHSDQVWLETVTVTSSNNYELSFEAGQKQYSFSENRMESAGTYLVTASYFDPDNDLLTADTSFDYEP